MRKRPLELLPPGTVMKLEERLGIIVGKDEEFERILKNLKGNGVDVSLLEIKYNRIVVEYGK